MAVDTRDKRASTFGFLPLTFLPLADTSISARDRQQAVGLYAGILAGTYIPPAAPSVSEYLKECWEDTFRPLLGKKPWPFRVR
jgi:hypothetical protein